MESLRYGLEIREAWCEQIRSGAKKIELRGYALPEHLLHEEIVVLSANGPEGKSLLGDTVEAGSDGILMVGTIKFSQIKRYQNEDQVEDDISLHLVEKGSSYGWKEGTGMLYGWVIERTEWFDMPRPNPAMTRLLRSVFELKPRR
jgi:hypothetical protein